MVTVCGQYMFDGSEDPSVYGMLGCKCYLPYKVFRRIFKNYSGVADVKNDDDLYPLEEDIP